MSTHQIGGNTVPPQLQEIISSVEQLEIELENHRMTAVDLANAD